MPVDEAILKELKKISKIIALSNGAVLEKELSKYATTEERKKIWVFIDGKNQSKDIAEKTGIPKRTVNHFLKILEEASLTERQSDSTPIRILDYVPPEWVSLIKIEESEDEPQTQEKPQLQEQSQSLGDQNG